MNKTGYIFIVIFVLTIFLFSFFVGIESFLVPDKTMFKSPFISIKPSTASLLSDDLVQINVTLRNDYMKTITIIDGESSGDCIGGSVVSSPNPFLIIMHLPCLGECAPHNSKNPEN